MIKITAFADTHGNHNKVKFDEKHLSSDLLVFGGDFSATTEDNRDDVRRFLSWLSMQPQKHKILIGGNWDFFADRKQKEFKSIIPKNIIYLNNESVTIKGYKIFGSPNTNLTTWAFGKYERVLSEHCYSKIPNDTDILITHTPPYEILDTNRYGQNCGSTSLREKLKELNNIKINIFGHTHSSSGVIKKDNIIFANVSVYNGEEPQYFEI